MDPIMKAIKSIQLFHVDLPLIRPYALSYKIFESFEPFLVCIKTDDGSVRWGEQHTSPGSSSETRKYGWNFLATQARAVVGKPIDQAYECLQLKRAESPVAAAAFLNALDQIVLPEQCQIPESIHLPVLSAFSAITEKEIEAELQEKLNQGYTTLKIKVGADAPRDRRRVEIIQRLIAGKGTIRVDANRAFSVSDAIEFCEVLDPSICELFEQPCDANDWKGNGDVAKVSPVPIMLDEPICSLDDIDRAAAMYGVGFCKVKLKRFGSITALEQAIKRAHEQGLEIVLGDGLGSDINCYLEAVVSHRHLARAGEFNGCLKIRQESRLLGSSIGFSRGHMIIPERYIPQPNTDTLQKHTVRSELFSA